MLTVQGGEMGHVVLGVPGEDRTLVLDNLRNRFVPWGGLRHYLPIYSLNERSAWLYAPQNALSASKLADLESLGEASQKLLEDIDAARERGNDNAVMGFTRIKMQMHGALKDAVSLSVEQRASDDDLIKSLAGDDPAKLAALRTILGAPNTFDTRH